ncbi:MAG: alpha/beta hydrolase domain-containing protein, partial [Candidatus Rokuibacteriota bacterium]
NEDESGRQVFDGVFVHIAGARRGEFNQRFGQPSLNATASAGSLFPFTDTAAVDPVTGERGAQLARLERRGTVPKIVAVNTSAEYWRGDASLVHADVEGARDVAPHPQTRLYLFAGCQHTPGTLPPPDADPNTGSRGLQMFNVVDYSPLARAVLTNLDRWVGGVEPPPSSVPRLADGTGVPAESTRERFAPIPGVRFPDRIERPRRLDFGPELSRGIVHELPPKIGAPFATFVPSVDDDGNDIPGIRAVELGAPLATFTGWNPRHPDQGAPGDLMSMLGSTLPFAITRAAREASGDRRPSIEERYPSRDAYLARAREAAIRLVAERHMLAEDVDAVVERAGRLWDFIVRA